ncbi:LysR family transcriptional regulator [Chelativorans sp. M5D2P16]|uniref:LysR family transcriptional regulator n=1 Tax=Chelativorans sp. M5D2P16 TaxID=3095678 RepID=UPI002ACAAF52|nr:LysR family transcriptional regulator [Chelativorans sp. M5D2P16]MDZ5699787.1 LysR family transcriptional regulator [Chelativorans sp. M5D2P16]
MQTTVLKSFLVVVEEESFSAAAKRLGISKSVCSKYISGLEAELGVRLLTRSTRSVRPTALGRQYFEKVRTILAELEAANDSVRDQSGKVGGQLKIGTPITYTLCTLRPLVLRFMKEYPDVRLELVLDDRHHDLIGQGFDAAISIGELDNSSLIARRLHGSRLQVVASPDYLAARGVPEHPRDLARHRSLYYTNVSGAETWTFHAGSGVIHQKIAPVFSSNNGDMIRSAALDGLGVSSLPEFLVADDLREGRLVRLLAGYEQPELPISLVYPSRKLATAALNAFLETIQRSYGRQAA